MKLLILHRGFDQQSRRKQSEVLNKFLTQNIWKLEIKFVTLHRGFDQQNRRKKSEVLNKNLT